MLTLQYQNLFIFLTPKKMNRQELIEQIIQLGEWQIRKPYVRGGKDEAWFDCSWFILWLFSQMGIQFEARFRTVEFYAGTPVISRQEAQRGDFIFWLEEPGKNEHNFVHHIEMLLTPPFQEEGKRYVRTLGASRDKDCFDLQNTLINQEWVGIRKREIDQRKSFARVPYYDQIVKYQEKSDSTLLFAPLPKDVKSKHKL